MSASPVAGWYPDNDDPALYRWWDGNAWTTDTKPSGAGAERAVASAADDLADDSAFYSIFPERTDGVHATTDVHGLAAENASRWKRYKWRNVPGIILGLIVIAFPPLLVAVIPIGLVALVIILLFSRKEGMQLRASLQRWAAVRGLTDEGGTLVFRDKAPKVPSSPTDDTTRALVMAGYKLRGLGNVRLRGRLWRAAPNATIQVLQGQPEYQKDLALITAVSIPLPPEVASRYPGVAAERPRQNGRFQLRAWPSVANDPNMPTPPSHVSAHPNQTNAADLVLTDQPVLERVGYVDGWVVAEGRLTAWTYGDLLYEIAMREHALENGKDPGEHAMAEDRLVHFLTLVADLHMVVLGADTSRARQAA